MGLSNPRPTDLKMSTLKLKEPKNLLLYPLYFCFVTQFRHSSWAQKRKFILLPTAQSYLCILCQKKTWLKILQSLSGPTVAEAIVPVEVYPVHTDYRVGLLEQTQASSFGGILVERSIVHLEKDRVPLRVMNHTRQMEPGLKSIPTYPKEL